MGRIFRIEKAKQIHNGWSGFNGFSKRQNTIRSPFSIVVRVQPAAPEKRAQNFVSMINSFIRLY